MENIKIFACDTAREFAQGVCDYLDLPLSDMETIKFKNDNTFVQIKESVREQDVYIFQTTQPPVNERVMELLIAIDALKRASARKINVVLPYYLYSRSDKKDQPRISVTAKLFAQLLEAAGATRVISCDLHNPAIQVYFSINCDRLSAQTVLQDYFKEKNLKDIVELGPKGTGKSHIYTEFSPHGTLISGGEVSAAKLFVNNARKHDIGLVGYWDNIAFDEFAGSSKKAYKYSEYFGCPIALIDKRRSGNNDKAIATNVIGDVKNKNALIFDDEVDTAGSLIETARILEREGAKAIYAGCTHGVLSADAVLRIDNSPIKELVITDTIPLTEDKKSEKIKVVSMVPMFAEAIKRLNESKPLGELFKIY